MDFTRTEAEQVRDERQSAEQLIEQHREKAGELIGRYRVLTEQFERLRHSPNAQPRAELAVVFEAVLEAQRQLLAARNELNRLESAHDTLGRYANYLDAVLNEFGEVMPRVLHDEVAPPLTNSILQIEIIQRLLDRNLEQARSELKDLKATATTAIQRIRGLMTDLRTPKAG